MHIQVHDMGECWAVPIRAPMPVNDYTAFMLLAVRLIDATLAGAVRNEC